MSLHGLMTGRRATRCALYRATTARADDGSTVETFAAVATVTGLAEAITAELAARVFGDAVQVELRLLVPVATDVREGDRLLVETGVLAGHRFRVTARRIEGTRPRSAHVACALVSTTEAFG